MSRSGSDVRTLQMCSCSVRSFGDSSLVRCCRLPESRPDSAHPLLAVGAVSLDGHFLDRAVRPLDPRIGPRMVGFRQPVLDTVGLANHVEAHRPGIEGIPAPPLVCELDADLRETGVDPIWDSLDRVLEKPSNSLSVSFGNSHGSADWVGGGSSVAGPRDSRLAAQIRATPMPPTSPPLTRTEPYSPVPSARPLCPRLPRACAILRLSWG